MRSTSVQPSSLGSVMIGNRSKSRRTMSLTLRAYVSSSTFPALARQGTIVDRGSQKPPLNLTNDSSSPDGYLEEKLDEE